MKEQLKKFMSLGSIEAAAKWTHHRKKLNAKDRRLNHLRSARWHLQTLGDKLSHSCTTQFSMRCSPHSWIGSIREARNTIRSNSREASWELHCSAVGARCCSSKSNSHNSDSLWCEPKSSSLKYKSSNVTPQRVEPASHKFRAAEISEEQGIWFHGCEIDDITQWSFWFPTTTSRDQRKLDVIESFTTWSLRLFIHRTSKSLKSVRNQLFHSDCAESATTQCRKPSSHPNSSTRWTPELHHSQ